MKKTAIVANLKPSCHSWWRLAVSGITLPTAMLCLAALSAFGTNGTAYYFDVNGTASGFGSPSGTYKLSSAADWNSSSAGTGTPVVFPNAAQMTFGASAGDLTGSIFTINCDSSLSMNGILFNGTSANVTLAGTANIFLPGASTPTTWTVAAGSTLTESNTFNNVGLNFNDTPLTLSGGGTINFNTTLGYNAWGSTGLITQNGPTVNLKPATAGSAGNAGYTLTIGTLNFANANAFGNLNTGGGGILSINGGTIDNTSGSSNTLANIGGGISVGGSFTFTGSSSLNFGTAGVTLTASPTLTISANTLEVDGIMSGASYGITKAGSGTLTLAGANNYGGNTTIGAGALVLQNTYASSGFSISSGAVLELNVASGSRDSATTTYSGTGTLRKTGGGEIIWGSGAATFNLGAGSLIDVQGGTFTGGSWGNEVWTGNLAALNVASGATFNGVEANVQVDALTGSGTIKSGFNGAGYASFTFGVNNGSGTFSGVLTNTDAGDAAAFVKTGSGIQTLSGVNTFTGGLTVNGGAVGFTANNQLGGASGNGAITLNGGALKGSTSGTTILSSARTITLGSSGGYFSAGFGGSIEIDSQLTGIGGVVAFNYDGSGTYILTGTANNYTGDTRIGTQGPTFFNDPSAAATLKMGAVNALPFGAGVGNVVVGYQASYSCVPTLDLNGYNTSINGLTNSTSNALVDNSSSTAATLTVGNNSATSTFRGVIKNSSSGGLGLTKAGSGTQTLSGANTYTGATTVNQGTLALGATGTLPTATTVNLNGGTLALGTFNNTVNGIQISGVTKAKGTWGASGSGANHISASMTGTGILTVTYGGSSTSVVTSSANPSTYGNVTFTNTVTGSGGDGSAPSGTVTFYDGANSIGTGALIGSSGTVSTYTFTISSLTVGTHSITANYAGNASYDVSTSSAVSQVVNQATSTATVTVNNSPAIYDGTGQAATVTLSGTNTAGSVTSILTGGAATQTAAGTYAVMASFVPANTNYTTLTGLSAGNFTINQAGTSVGASSSENPSGYKDSVSFLATLPVYATGSVVFSYTNRLISTNSVNSGTATSLSITNLPRGTNVITVAYLGDGNYIGSTNTLLQVVSNHPPVAAVLTVTRTAGLRLLIPLFNLSTNWSDVDGDTVELTGVNMQSTNGVNLLALNWSTNLDGSIVTTNAYAYIGYTNSPNVADQISYSIGDGQGGTNIGYVNIVIQSSVTGTNSITAYNFTSASSNVIKAYGIPYFYYILERATNLSSPVWVDVQTIQAATNGVINAADTFWDLGGSKPSPAFYQLKWQP